MVSVGCIFYVFLNGVDVWTVCRYISTGLGRGNPYGLAAVCAVCFPFFFYGKMYWPGSPMFTMIVRRFCCHGVMRTTDIAA